MYRIYDKVNEKYDEDLVALQDDTINNLSIRNQANINQQDYIVERATGLKTMNGVEIYENDVVTSEDNDPHFIKYREDRTQFVGVGIHNGLTSPLDEYAMPYKEVIGTIHDTEFKHLVNNNE